MELSAYDINPKILRAAYFDGYELPPDTKMEQRVCYDYELEYYTQSTGGILCNGKLLSMCAGDINIRKPGQRVQGVLPYAAYIVCVHITGGAAPAGYVLGDAAHAQPRHHCPLLEQLPDRLTPENSRYVRELFAEIYAYSHRTDDFGVFHRHRLLHSLMEELFRQVEDGAQRLPSVNPQVMQAADAIRRNFCEPLNIRRTIAATGLSPAYFHKCFRQYTGHTPLELQRALRMEKAKELLYLSDSPVADIALLCGYDDPVYFTSLFRRHTGMSPTRYRASRGSNQET